MSNDLELDIDFDESEVIDIDDGANEKSSVGITEDSIVPKDKILLGLDISQNSSGICIYRNGVKTLCNSYVVFDKNNPHAEAYMRYQLKKDLLEVINNDVLDLIVIEDVFDGKNPEIVRRLYALNTAIDDLILENKVSCKEFVRVPNGTWKKWLSVIDKNNLMKGYSDKQRVRAYLEMIGITDDGDGFQDRLDATGMIIGYLLCGKDELSKSSNSRVSVSINDVVCDYELDIDLISSTAHIDNEDELSIILIDDSRLSKKKILEYLSKDFNSVYITRDPIRIGVLADYFGLPLLGEDKGYFGFWVSSKAKKKYIKKLERVLNGG